MPQETPTTLSDRLRPLDEKLEGLIKDVGRAIAEDNRVYMSLKEMEIQLGVSRLLFQLVGARECIAGVHHLSRSQPE